MADVQIKKKVRKVLKDSYFKDPDDLVDVSDGPGDSAGLLRPLVNQSRIPPCFSGIEILAGDLDIVGIEGEQAHGRPGFSERMTARFFVACS